MSESPGSPKAKRLATPTWLDTRLVLGVLLVVTSVVVGARVLSAADRSQPVWVTTRAIAPGAVLTDGDLAVGRVRLFGNPDRYVSADGPKPTGWVARRGLGPDELLPLEAITPPSQDEDFRLVTVAVSRSHLPPDLEAGQQVDVWLTPDEDAQQARQGQAGQPAAPLFAPRLVLRNVTVVRRDRGGGLVGSDDEQPVVLRVRPHEVAALVGAMSQGQIDLVRVPRYQEREQLPAVPAG